MSKKIYITTAIDYANNIPHIGHALEKVQADVMARYLREKKYNVYFLTGSDEHGAKIFRSAERANKTPQEFVNESSQKFKDLKKILNLSWDYFVRTSDQKIHWPSVFKIWKILFENGDIYKKKYSGLYCVGCEAFKTEKELVGGKCPDHLKEPEIIEEENYFFKLSKYSKIIESKIKNDSIKIIPASKKKEMLSIIKDGLGDASISRLKKNSPWGIPVPNDKNQTIYVWFEALINYLSGIGYANPKFKPKTKTFSYWWPADIHFIGKDIVKFHAIIWPAMLIAAKLSLPKKIFVHGFISSGSQKMSKSIGNIVSPEEIARKYGTDALRYYLLKDVPPCEDGDYSEEKFIARYNGDLANGLGNFSARILAMSSKSKISVLNKLDKNIFAKIKQTKKNTNKKIEEFKFNEALALIWEMISFGDEYINKKEPWKVKDEAEKQKILFNLVVILQNIAQMTSVFLPETSEKILKNIKITKKAIKTKKAENLFPRIQ